MWLLFIPDNYGGLFLWLECNRQCQNNANERHKRWLRLKTHGWMTGCVCDVLASIWDSEYVYVYCLRVCLFVSVLYVSSVPLCFYGGCPASKRVCRLCWSLFCITLVAKAVWSLACLYPVCRSLFFYNGKWLKDRLRATLEFLSPGLVFTHQFQSKVCVHVCDSGYVSMFVSRNKEINDSYTSPELIPHHFKHTNLAWLTACGDELQCRSCFQGIKSNILSRLSAPVTDA